MNEKMNFKKGGLLEKIANKLSAEGVCETCNNLLQFDSGALGCIAHDKLIIPQFIPYTNSNFPCKDWQRREKNER